LKILSVTVEMLHTWVWIGNGRILHQLTAALFVRLVFQIIFYQSYQLVVHKWVWILGYNSPLFLSFFLQFMFLDFNIFKYYFYTSFCGFSESMYGFWQCFKLLEYAGTCMMEVPDNIHVTVGWRRQVFYCRLGVSFLSPDL